MINLCIFSGRFTKDPELKKTQNSSVCSFSIAVNEGYGDNQQTQYPKITAWGKTAEYISKYGKKGMYVEVTSRYNQKQYQDTLGNTVHTHEFVASKVQLIFEKNESNRGNDSGINEDDGNFNFDENFPFPIY